MFPLNKSDTIHVAAKCVLNLKHPNQHEAENAVRCWEQVLHLSPELY